ncbi:hypothetical protein EHE19_010930 [Ruminiclostridium herbifermentans]|uniref:Uncharacterized protein n=1 Tax=Ruminiclostridium herbifermentans TaxID=2488810 RepID=A0A4U7JJX7_9FIRM|nr:hypothetical protein [Ruminiclostridium herbifermentans]QNU65446.1 hypothetical protein EHE19_010930 [Ruminiclostridium herbifermentans]
MKKLVFLTVCIMLLVIAVSGCSSSASQENSRSFTLHETPQTYALVDDDFTKMPTVTLYENGNARLSQPLISSVGMLGIGHYQVRDDELVVTCDPNTSVTFSISDNGDTLTMKMSSGIAFTKIGAVYKYRSKAEYLSEYSKKAGDALTLDIVRDLAQKGNTLTQADFEKYACVIVDPYYRIYDVEGKYTLTIIDGEDGNASFTIERNASGESFPLDRNGSTGLVFDDFLGIKKIPDYKTQKWFDYLNDEKKPWGENIELSLPEFPGVKFTCTSEKISDGKKDLIFGMPVWNAYLADLTNDGKPEICTTVSIGSGIIDNRVVVYDYVNDKEYQLADRMHYDYYLSMEDGKLMVTQTEYNKNKPLVTTQLQLVNSEILKP